MNTCLFLSHDIVVTQSLFPYNGLGRERETFSLQEKTAQGDTLESKTGRERIGQGGGEGEKTRRRGRE